MKNNFKYDYGEVIEATFLSRPNRFIREIEINGEKEIAHVKNTGRLEELLVNNRTCFVKKAKNPNRKTRFDLISVKYKDIYVNLDSQITNTCVEGLFKNNLIEGYENIDEIKREVVVGNSRLDLKVIKDGIPTYIEVKQTNLVEDYMAMFPDSKTIRGKRHIEELIELKKKNINSMLIFLIVREDVNKFRPRFERDIEFSKIVYEAIDYGVDVRAYNMIAGPNFLEYNKRIKIMDKNEFFYIFNEYNKKEKI